MDLATFLQVVHCHTPEGALIGLSRLKDRGMVTRWFLRKFRDDMLPEAISKNLEIDTYLRITPVGEQPTKGRGTETDALGSSVLWVDYDCYSSQLEGLMKLKGLEKPPTLIVNSGRGLQAYWLLDRFYNDLSRIKGANKALVAEIDPKAVDSCYDLARVLRVPGTYNCKNPEQPVLASILHYDPQLVYELSSFKEAPLDGVVAIQVWEAEPIEDDLLEEIKAKDRKLYDRIYTEESARKAGAPVTSEGVIDRSKNDYYVTRQLLKLGYSAAMLLSVLTHPIWFSGLKHRLTGRYDYVVTTVNTCLGEYEASEEQYFNGGKTFQPTKMAAKVIGNRAFLFANETLYRYYGGYFQRDGTEWIRKEVAQRLGARWQSRYSAETVTYIIDTNRIDPKDLNNHTDLVNVRNGMINIRSGELTEHSPDFLSIHQLPIDYDPAVESGELDYFLASILPHSAIPVFWEYVGSCLLQNQYWPKAFLALVGPGNTGKSKLLEWVFRFFGEDLNCTALDLQTLADNRFAMAHLFGKMANIFSDLNEAEAKNTGQIKALTGDDTVGGEKKGKDHFFFKSTARLFFSSNHFPAVRSPDEAFFERAIIIPCTRRFTRETADRNIVAKLSTPLHFSAGLNRALEGLKRLTLQNGFSPSEEILEANQAFRFSADTVAGFLGQCRYVPGYRITKQAMYQAYRTHCEQGNRRIFSDDKFFKRMRDILDQFGVEEVFPAAKEGEPRTWYYENRQPPTTFGTNLVLKGKETTK